jgi:hypothetical protein
VLPWSISSASLEDLFTGGGGDSERIPFGFSPLGFPSDFGASSVGEPWAEVEMGGRAICSRFFSVVFFFFFLLPQTKICERIECRIHLVQVLASLFQYI